MTPHRSPERRPDGLERLKQVFQLSPLAKDVFRAQLPKHQSFQAEYALAVVLVGPDGLLSPVLLRPPPNRTECRLRGYVAILTMPCPC